MWASWPNRRSPGKREDTRGVEVRSQLQASAVLSPKKEPRVKIKVSLEYATKAQRGEMYSSILPSTSALDDGGWSTPRSGRFTPMKGPVPIVQEAGWASRAGLDGCAKSRPPTGIRSPDRPARSQSLYRLSYRGTHLKG